MGKEENRSLGFTDKRLNIMINKIGLTEGQAMFCYEFSKKYCLWLANQIKLNPIIVNKIVELNLILDWKREVQDVNLNELSFSQAHKLAVKFHNALFVPNPNGLKNKNVILDCGEYKWVQLRTNEDCVEEGRTMGHCIGGSGHAGNISFGRSVAFSLRDKFNKPHLTLEARCESNGTIGSIFEFKGMSNSVPDIKYTEHFVALLKKFKFEGVTDTSFFSSVAKNIKLAKAICAINNDFIPFNMKLSFGIAPFAEGEFFANEIISGQGGFDNKGEIIIPEKVSFYNNVKLGMGTVKLKNDIVVGGSLTLIGNKVIIGKNLQIAGNLTIDAKEIVFEGEVAVFGSILFNKKAKVKMDKNLFTFDGEIVTV